MPGVSLIPRCRTVEVTLPRDASQQTGIDTLRIDKGRCPKISTKGGGRESIVGPWTAGEKVGSLASRRRKSDIRC